MVVAVGFTTSVPEFGLTDTGEPGNPAPEIVAVVPPVAVHESVEAPPEQTGEADAVKAEIEGGWLTVIVTSRVRVLHPFDAVSLYVRVVGGVTESVPASVARFVTVFVVRSVIERAVELETLKLRVAVCPALMVEAVAVNELMTTS